LIAYDYLLMLPKEQKHIWNAKWTPGKVLYIAVRYMPIFDIPILPFGYAFLAGNLHLGCVFDAWWQIATNSIACLLADIVYGLRTWALWNRNRLLGCFLIAADLAFNISAGIAMFIIQRGLPSINIPGLPGCFMLPFPTNNIWKAYLLTTGFELGRRDSQ